MMSDLFSRLHRSRNVFSAPSSDDVKQEEVATQWADVMDAGCKIV